jgi:superfamily II DNA or RNA helicase
MGDDSTPRRVLSTCKGRETLYQIQQMRGDSYIVNESHILSLKNSNGDIIDISVKDYVSNKYYEYYPLYGYKVDVEFSNKDIIQDPYIIGLELNKKYNYIPYEYKCTSYVNRLALFKGIVDANKYLVADHLAIFYINNNDLANDIIYLVRSLGFTCYKKYIYSENKYKLFVYKNKITPIKIKKLEKGTYYGFEIDGNHRFLLGDFTVTHNTVCGLNIICELKKKALIICHKEFLLNQWKERIQQFIPTAYVGLIKAQTIKVDNYDIVLGSLQSISMKEYDPELFKQFGVVLFDEVHHLSAETFSKAMPKVTAPIFLGLSATLNRKDGLRKVFEWFIGKVVNDIIVRTDKSLLVKMIKYFDTEEDYGIERFLWNGKRNSAAMISDICSYVPRIKKIVDEYVLLITAEPGRKTLILSGRREHLNDIEFELKRRNYKSIGYYVGGMKELDLKKSESCDIILATYSMASEGMDIPVLNTLILASPIGDIEQAVGRIQRQKPHERTYVPYIIEFWDQYSLFQIQGLRHLRFYKKNGYSFVNDENNTNNQNTNEQDNEEYDEVEETNDLKNEDISIKMKKNNQKYDFIDDD